MTTPVVDEKYELDSPTYRDEKRDFADGDSNSQVAVDDQRARNHALNEEFHFTWRSAIVGSLLGCLVGTLSYIISALVFFFFTPNR